MAAAVGVETLAAMQRLGQIIAVADMGAMPRYLHFLPWRNNHTYLIQPELDQITAQASKGLVCLRMKYSRLYVILLHSVLSELY